MKARKETRTELYEAMVIQTRIYGRDEWVGVPKKIEFIAWKWHSSEGLNLDIMILLR